jgi:hypothetical protein
VLDDHGGGSGGRQHVGEHLPDQRDPGRVEVRGDLVEQQQPGAQRDDAGQASRCCSPPDSAPVAASRP